MRTSSHHGNLFRKIAGLTYNLSAGKTVNPSHSFSGTLVSMAPLSGIPNQSGFIFANNTSTIQEIANFSTGNLYVDFSTTFPANTKIIVQKNGTFFISFSSSTGLFYSCGWYAANEVLSIKSWRAGTLSTYFPTSFSDVRCVRISTDESIIFTDLSNSIRSISTSKVLSTIRAANSDLSNPQGFDYDASGNLYICDQGSDTIKKLTPSGVLSTFCGSGINGYQDGSPSEARFSNPKCITYLSLANCFYVSDANNVIRKIDMSGNCYTVAGIAGAGGYQNGPASSALFSNITQIFDRKSATYPESAYILEGLSLYRILF